MECCERMGHVPAVDRAKRARRPGVTLVCLPSAVIEQITSSIWHKRKIGKRRSHTSDMKGGCRRIPNMPRGTRWSLERAEERTLRYRDGGGASRPLPAMPIGLADWVPPTRGDVPGAAPPGTASRRIGPCPWQKRLAR